MRRAWFGGGFIGLIAPSKADIVIEKIFNGSAFRGERAFGVRHQPPLWILGIVAKRKHASTYPRDIDASLSAIECLYAAAFVQVANQDDGCFVLCRN
jgi:hypothetical protein